MAKRLFVVHKWEGTPNSDWYPWLKKELENKGFEVTVPQLPDTNTPHIAKWVPFLQSLVKNPDEDTYFVGHSAGCITILRYAERLPENIKIGGTVLVAGFTDDLGYNELSNFFQTPIEWEKILSHSKKFVAINSNNDPYVPLKHGYILKEKLNAKLIVENNKGHFSQKDGGITELPSILNSVLEISS